MIIHDSQISRIEFAEMKLGFMLSLWPPELVAKPKESGHGCIQYMTCTVIDDLPSVWYEQVKVFGVNKYFSSFRVVAGDTHGEIEESGSH